MSYYLFHITNDEDTSKVYKFDTNNLYLIFKYIIRKWRDNYLRFIKYTQVDTRISRSIPDSILKIFNNKIICMNDMIYKINIQDLLKLFRVRFGTTKKNILDDGIKCDILSYDIYQMDYIYIQKLDIKDTDDVIALHCAYDLENNCRCEPLKFADLPMYYNTTYFGIETLDIVYKISDIETISAYPNTDLDIKERIEFIDEFQEFLIGYECGHRLIIIK